jgi:hypothetical protein
MRAGRTRASRGRGVGVGFNGGEPRVATHDARALQNRLRRRLRRRRPRAARAGRAGDARCRTRARPQPRRRARAQSSRRGQRHDAAAAAHDQKRAVGARLSRDATPTRRPGTVRRTIDASCRSRFGGDDGRLERDERRDRHVHRVRAQNQRDDGDARSIGAMGRRCVPDCVAHGTRRVEARQARVKAGEERQARQATGEAREAVGAGYVRTVRSRRSVGSRSNGGPVITIKWSAPASTNAFQSSTSLVFSATVRSI